jgi:Cu(I)/Ag(I) efflux system membrane protein CusA/SilA
MTVAAAFIGLVPLLWAHGSGADVMRRLAAPLIGGLAVSFVMELVVYPVIFFIAKRFTLRHAWKEAAFEPPQEIDGHAAPKVEHATHA